MGAPPKSVPWGHDHRVTRPRTVVVLGTGGDRPSHITLATADAPESQATPPCAR